MTAIKALKRIGKVVFVDINELNSSELNAHVKSALNDKKLGNSIPKVVVVNPALNKTYGALGYNNLKGQEYSKIFRGMKKKIKEAKSNGELKEAFTTVNETPEEEGKSDQPDFTSTKYEDFTSSKGSSIHARLIKATLTTYTFKLKNGKTISATADQLTPESVERLKEIIAEITPEAKE